VPLGEPAAEASIETSRSENAWDFCFDQKLLEIYGEEKLGSVADSDWRELIPNVSCPFKTLAQLAATAHLRSKYWPNLQPQPTNWNKFRGDNETQTTRDKWLSFLSEKPPARVRDYRCVVWKKSVLPPSLLLWIRLSSMN
jgi:hypothetical protein